MKIISKYAHCSSKPSFDKYPHTSQQTFHNTVFSSCQYLLYVRLTALPQPHSSCLPPAALFSTMQNYRFDIASFGTEANSTVQRKVEELRQLLIVEINKLHEHCLSLVHRSLEQMETMLLFSLHAEVSQTEGLLRAFRRMVEGSVLEYRMEAIFEDIKARITVSEVLQRLSTIKTADFRLVFSLFPPPISPPFPVCFQIYEPSSVPRPKRHMKHASTDWLCRNCVQLNRHIERNCRKCGFQPKDTQADL